MTDSHRSAPSSPPHLPAILPSPDNWLGVMGGGQLGRMFVHAAQSMGYKVAVLENHADCPAGQVADHTVLANYDDVEGLHALAARCRAITTEFENVPATSLRQLAEQRFVAPGADAVAVAQHRMHEKQFFSACQQEAGIGPAPHHFIHGMDDLAAVAPQLFPAILKTLAHGYDGKGQVRVARQEDLADAFASLKQQPCVLEKMLDIEYEVSLLAVRAHDGSLAIYPPAQNEHRGGILHTSMVPAPALTSATENAMRHAGEVILQRLHYVGVLCIEFFVLRDGQLVVNEMAPRPHNSGHYSLNASVTSQFEQQARVMARLPLGSTALHCPVIMLNLLGDLWFAHGDSAQEPAWDQILALPGACLHLYGKQEARVGRKMGHINFLAPTLDEARRNLQTACGILGINA